MWALLENIFEYSSFKHTWEDGTHRTEFKCENCYKIVDIGQNNEIGQLPRVSTEDRDRVVSVFEFFVPSCKQIFSFFVL